MNMKTMSCDAQLTSGEIIRGKCPGKLSGEGIFSKGNLLWENDRGIVLKENCPDLVNTHTHRQTDRQREILTGYSISSAR